MLINSKKRTIKVKIKRKMHKPQKILKTQNQNPRKMLKSKTKRTSKPHKKPHKTSSTSAKLQFCSKTVIGLAGESHLPSKEMTSKPMRTLT
jgi:hypothetical protein